MWESDALIAISQVYRLLFRILILGLQVLALVHVCHNLSSPFSPQLKRVVVILTYLLLVEPLVNNSHFHATTFKIGSISPNFRKIFFLLFIFPLTVRIAI